MVSFEQTVRRLDEEQLKKDQAKHKRFTLLTAVFALATFLSLGGSVMTLASPGGLVACVVMDVLFAVLTVICWRVREESVLEFDYNFDGERETFTVGKIRNSEKYQKFLVMSRSTWQRVEAYDPEKKRKVINCSLNEDQPRVILTYEQDGKEHAILLEPNEKLRHLLDITMEQKGKNG